MSSARACVLSSLLVVTLAGCGRSTPPSPVQAPPVPQARALPAPASSPADGPAPTEAGFVLTEVHGDVQVSDGPGLPTVPVKQAGLPLARGARIHTGKGEAHALLRAPDGTEVALADGVDISLERLSATAAWFALGRGKVRALAQPGGRALTVDSQGAQAEASGARFIVYASPRGLVAVASESGSVKLRARNREVEVAAGKQSIVPPHGAPTDPIAVPDQVFLEVSWPTEEVQRASQTVVAGRARPGERVRVNGGEVEVALDGSFHAAIPLQEGKNPPLSVEAEALGGKRRLVRGPSIEVRNNVTLEVKPVDWHRATKGTPSP